jgi:hypothetical protein
LGETGLKNNPLLPRITFWKTDFRAGAWKRFSELKKLISIWADKAT